ncbi:MAG: hypothetical protein AOA66_1404 [Candidatus Bathyarchaeota archaeon BA2]|nr:MAG: hypothetical protein AOA66_1404 [Candidatus Bathyarchaeota archaeon BA2]
MNHLVKAVFTEEDRKNLRLIAEEVPKLRLLMDELLETLDVMGSKEELEAIKESLEQVRRGRPGTGMNTSMSSERRAKYSLS